MDRLRVPFFIVALIAALLTLLLELGSPGLARFLAQYIDSAALGHASGQGSPPGLALGSQALFDGLLFLTLGLMGLSLIIPDAVHARVQGIVSFVVSLGILIGAIVMLVLAIVKLLLMIMLLFAFIFGTIAYFAMFSSFPVNSARAVVSTLMAFKFCIAIMLILAHQRFLENKSLIIVMLFSFLITIIVGFLHGIVPGFLVSITDALAAIIICIIAIIWAIVYLVGSVISVIKTIKV